MKKVSVEKRAVVAVDFESRKVYQSQQHPGYTSWVSFFPGEHGQWYLTCEEVTRPSKPLPQCTRDQWFEMGLPVGYDKSPYQMEMVILESRDEMKTWEVISREPCRFHHSAGSFGQARTKDGRFLRFVWSDYSLDPLVQPNEIFYESIDNGKTWKKMPPFHDKHFVSYPHRLRTLRDGTLILCVPLRPGCKIGTERPVRTAISLDVLNEMQMTIFISHDQGGTWNGPLPIYGGQNVSETDFVELPTGDLLFINNSIFAYPGRQFVYRDGTHFTPGPLEKVRFAEHVPETVCLTEEGILIGCLRCSVYMWSDDLGQTWWPLEGAKNLSPEMYQPWIQYLGKGRIACAGHYGADDPVFTRDQYLSIHSFRVKVLHKTKDTQILVKRDFDEIKNRYRNSYVLTLICDGHPLANKDLEFWYVERYKPGYASWNKCPIEKRMKMGGKILKVRTGMDGKTYINLPHLEKININNIHLSYQFIVRFNFEYKYPDYKPAQTPQLEFYAVSYQEPPR